MAKPGSDRLTPAQFNKFTEEDKLTFVESLKEYYFNQNMPREKVLDVMHITISTLKHVMKIYELKKDKSLIKQLSDASKEERYGNKNYNNRDKSKQTCLDKYGVDNPLKVDEIKEQVRLTNNEKYGGNAPACSTEVQEKMQATCLERYGVKNIRLSETHKQIIKEKMSKTIQEKYGVPYYCLTEHRRNAQGHIISKVNQRFASLLSQNNISFEQEFVIENRSFDFKVDNILIEINPTYTHNSTFGPFIKDLELSPKDKNYHLEKTKLANKYKYRCIHVFENDDWNKIINILLPKQTIYARNCSIEEVSIKDCNEFLNEHHLQNTCKNQSIRYGLYYNNELVQIMTFGKPRYNKKYEYELLRLCSNSKFNIVGGSNKLFKHFVANHNPFNIISYCDNSKFSGNVYSSLGMKEISLTQPVGNWYNFDGVYVSDSLLRQRGFDQLFKTDFGKGTSNEELMKLHGFVQVYNCGQKVFVYN